MMSSVEQLKHEGRPRAALMLIAVNWRLSFYHLPQARVK
jgi:hypothetical protein